MNRSCETCRHYLGNGQCRINLEPECGAGEHEAWEPVDTAPAAPHSFQEDEDGH